MRREMCRFYVRPAGLKFPGHYPREQHGISLLSSEFWYLLIKWASQFKDSACSELMELPFVFVCLFVVSLIDVYSQIIFIFQVGESARPVFCFFDEFGEYASEASARKRKQNNSSFFFPHLHPLTLALNKCPVGHTIPDTFCAATKIKPYQIRPLFTHKNCKLSGAISVTEQSCAVPISKVKRHKSYRFCGILWCSVNTYLARRGSK